LRTLPAIFIPALLWTCAASPLVVLNETGEPDIVSLYVWEYGGGFKGKNLLRRPMPSGTGVTVEVPVGKINILAFDELDNSYGIAGFIKKSPPDTVSLDFDDITYGRPNLDFGPYLLTVTNLLHGFALDTLRVTSLEGNDDTLTVDDIRLFPGCGADLWLKKGEYHFTATDQAGRTLDGGVVNIPGDDILGFTEAAAVEPPIIVGEAGAGDAGVLLENRMPYSDVTEIVLYAGDDPVLFLEGLELEPGESVLLLADPGVHLVRAVDDAGASYVSEFDFSKDVPTRAFLVYDMLEYDFSFPRTGGGG